MIFDVYAPLSIAAVVSVSVELGHGALGEVAAYADCHSSCMSARMAPTRRMTAGSLGNVPTKRGWCSRFSASADGGTR